MTLQIFCAWRSLKRAAEDGEILREDEHQPAVDGARSGDDAVAGDALLGHAEIGAIMLDEHVIFFEAVGVEQHRNPLAGGEPALGVLRCNTLGAAAEPRRFAPSLQLFDGRRHKSPPRRQAA